MNRLAENLWEVEQPLRLPGLRINHRMTVVRLRSGQLWIHSPVEYGADVARSLAELGPVGHLVAPSRFHDLYWREWFVAHPEATFYCTPGLQNDHPQWALQRVLSPEVEEAWEHELPKHFIRGMPRVNEFVFFHEETKTLIVADLIFNLATEEQNLLGKLFLKWNAIHGRAGISRMFRSFIRDRAAFHGSIDEILQRDFQQLLPGHGAVIATKAKEILRRENTTMR